MSMPAYDGLVECVECGEMVVVRSSGTCPCCGYALEDCTRDFDPYEDLTDTEYFDMLGLDNV